VPRYPSNVPRQAYERVSRALRGDSFQGRSRTTLSRRSVGVARSVVSEPVLDEAGAAEIEELAFARLAPKLGARFIPYVGAALTAYQLWQLLNDMKGTGLPGVPESITGIPGNYTQSCNGGASGLYTGQRKFLNLPFGSCGALVTLTSWNGVYNNVNPTHISLNVARVPAPMNTNLWAMQDQSWDRVTSIPGQVVNPVYSPPVAARPGPLTAPRVNPWPSLDPQAGPVLASSRAPPLPRASCLQAHARSYALDAGSHRSRTSPRPSLIVSQPPHLIVFRPCPPPSNSNKPVTASA